MKKIICIICVFLYFVFPVNSFALTYNQFMVLTGSGKTKVAAGAMELGTEYLVARRLLGMTGTIGGTVILAMTLWDAYNTYQDYSKASLTFPSNTGIQPTPDGTSPVSTWGITGNYVCTRTFNRTRNVPPACPSKWLGGFSDYVDQNQSCTYENNPGYIQVGGKSYFSGQEIMLNSDCTHEDSAAWYPLQSIIVTYYGPKAIVAPQAAASEDSVEAQTEFNGSPEQNTKNMLDTITAAQKLCDDVNSIMHGFPPLDSISEFCKRFGLGGSHPEIVSVVHPTDYGNRSGTDPQPGPDPNDPPGIPPPDPDKSPTLDPPATPDGQCSEYVPTENWDAISASISAALAASPLFSLISKISDITGSGSLNHTLTIPFGGLYPSATVNLDDYYFSDVLAVLRWSLIAGAFIFAYKIAFS